MTKYIFQIISLSSVWIPILLILWHFNKLEKALKYLGLFLLWGFLNDIKYFYDDLKPYTPILIGVYSLSEILFFTWLIPQLENGLKKKSVQWTFALLVSFIWIACYFNVYLGKGSEPKFSAFDVISAITLTFASAYALLQLTKKETPLLQQSSFWILTGIFIYFMFSTLIFAFMPDKELRDKVWFIHCFFDMSKMALFSVGIIVAGKRHQLESDG